jgi:hypothetical protein
MSHDPPNRNEIVMMDGSEPVRTNTRRTRRPPLQAVKGLNKVEDLQNAASPPCVLIIRSLSPRDHIAPLKGAR